MDEDKSSSVALEDEEKKEDNQINSEEEPKQEFTSRYDNAILFRNLHAISENEEFKNLFGFTEEQYQKMYMDLQFDWEEFIGHTPPDDVMDLGFKIRSCIGVVIAMVLCMLVHVFGATGVLQCKYDEMRMDLAKDNIVYAAIFRNNLIAPGKYYSKNIYDYNDPLVWHRTKDVRKRNMKLDPKTGLYYVVLRDDKYLFYYTDRLGTLLPPNQDIYFKNQYLLIIARDEYSNPAVGDAWDLTGVRKENDKTIVTLTHDPEVTDGDYCNVWHALVYKRCFLHTKGLEFELLEKE